jgi:hypothetical protein
MAPLPAANVTSRREPVRRRLIARLQEDNAPTVLDADVDEDAAELLKAEIHAVLSGETDAPAYCMEAFVILGWLFWKRCLRTRVEDERSLKLALVLFAPVVAANPSVVPEALLGELPRSTPSGEPPVGVWINMVGEIVTGPEQGDRTALLAGAGVLAMGLGMSPPKSDDRWRCQDNLVYVLSSLYEAHDDSEALAEAVEMARWSAADATPGTAMHARSVRRLVETLHLAYNATGDHVVLTEAIENARAAVRTYLPGHEELIELINILAGLLISRHSATRDTSSLVEATDMLRGLLKEVSTDHPAYATSRGHLATVLGLQHRVDSDPALADEIVDLCRSALNGIPPDHPIRPRVFAALTDILVVRARRTGSVDDIEEALSSARQAVAEVPPGKRVPGQALQALAVVLAAWHEQFDDTAAFDEAVDLLQRGTSEAVNEVERADLLFTLAALWNNRYEATRDPEHARAAVTALQAAATSSGCSARQQVRAAVAAAEILGELGEWCEATEQMGTAVELLSTLAGRHLPIGDRRSALSEFMTAPVRAASYAIEAGQPERALELLECGRGLLFSENAAFRNGVGKLASRAPKLASALTRVITELDIATNADGRHQLDRDRQRLIDQVRELDGFEDFLKPQKLSEILDACRSGPVVVPLAARERLDALIVTTEGAHPVSLSHEPFEKFRTHIRQLIEGVGIATDRRSSSADRRHGDNLVQLGLDWLWDAITGPVLDALGLRRAAPDGGKLPRVWWCPTGMLSYVPLHAAGHLGGPQALDHAVFSYTSSIRMLSQTPSWRLRKDSSPLVVGLSRTPGLADLPAVEQELAFLAGTFSQRRILRNDAATRAQIMAALPDHDIAHFACHGGSNPVSHYEGQLFVHDKALSLSDIATIRVDQARLAFLSACTTARPGLELPDEALSIATGFQLAGYSDVVASLWPIADQKAFQVTSDFYTDLTTGPGSSVAYALHRAVQKLRAREPERPSLWTPYIHLGA